MDVCGIVCACVRASLLGLACAVIPMLRHGKQFKVTSFCFHGTHGSGNTAAERHGQPCRWGGEQTRRSLCLLTMRRAPQTRAWSRARRTDSCIYGILLTGSAMRYGWSSCVRAHTPMRHADR